MIDLLDALEVRLLNRLTESADGHREHLRRVEKLIHAVFHVLNTRIKNMAIDLKQDVLDLEAAAAAQGTAISNLVAEVGNAVVALDDLAKKVADAIAGAGDLTALSAQIRAVKDNLIASTAPLIAADTTIEQAIARDDPPAPPAPPAAPAPADVPVQ